MLCSRVGTIRTCGHYLHCRQQLFLIKSVDKHCIFKDATFLNLTCVNNCAAWTFCDSRWRISCGSLNAPDVSATQSGTWLLQRKFSWMKAIVTCTHSTNLEFLDAFQGMHLQTCGEVIPLGGSDTCNHVWTSPRSYVQQCLLQHLPDHPLLRLSMPFLGICLCLDESQWKNGNRWWDLQGMLFLSLIYFWRERYRVIITYGAFRTRIRGDIVCQGTVDTQSKWA